MSRVILIVFLGLLCLCSIGCTKDTSKLRLGLIAPSTDHLPVGYALEKGFLSHDLVKIHYFTSGWEVNEALITGRIDIAIMPFTYGWQAVAEGKEVKIISFFERESDGIIARKGIDNIRQLDGLRLGTLRASTLDVFAHMVAEDFNINPEIVYFRTPTEMAIALKRGYVDALSFYVPAIFNFTDDMTIIFWYSEYYPKHPCCDLIASDEAIENKEDQIRELLKVLEESCYHLSKSMSESIKHIERSYKLSLEVAESTLKHTKFIMGFDEEGVAFQQQTAKKMYELGYLRRQVAPGEVYYDINKNKEEGAD